MSASVGDECGAERRLLEAEGGVVAVTVWKQCSIMNSDLKQGGVTPTGNEKITSAFTNIGIGKDETNAHEASAQAQTCHKQRSIANGYVGYWCDRHCKKTVRNLKHKECAVASSGNKT